MKTVENVKLMKKFLINELTQLPQVNAFGDSNELEKLRLQNWIIDLAYIEKFGLTCDNNSEVSFWFNDDCWTPLCDYEEFVKAFEEHEQILRYAYWLNM